MIARHRSPRVRFEVGSICRAGDGHVAGGGPAAGLRDTPDTAAEVHEYDSGFRWLRDVCLPLIGPHSGR